MNEFIAGLHLRALEPEDVDFMYEVENDEALWIVSDRKAPLSRRVLLEYALGYDADPISAGQLRLVLSDAAGSPVGLLDLYDIDVDAGRTFVGVTILPTFRSRGVATRGLELLRQYCSRHLNIHRLAAKVDVCNHASRSLFEGCGYRKIATLPEWHKRNGECVDVDLYLLSDSSER